MKEEGGWVEEGAGLRGAGKERRWDEILCGKWLFI